MTPHRNDKETAPESFTLRTGDGVALDILSFGAANVGPAVIVLHGIISHKGWYRWIGEELARHGFSVFLMDRRGCGLSGGDRGHAASWKTLIADVAALLSEIEKRRLGVAIHLLGISLGATVGLGTSLFHPGRIRSQILLSPGLKSAVRLPLLRRLRLLRRSVVEPTKLYELPFTLDQVTDRAQWQEAYRQDCLRTSRVSARFLVEVFRMQRFIRRRVCRIDAPIYALLAGKDLIVDNVATLEALSRAQSARVEIFKGAFHNLTVALPRHELAMRLTTWMLNEASERPPGVRVASVEGTFPEETLPSPIVESQFPLR